MITQKHNISTVQQVESKLVGKLVRQPAGNSAIQYLAENATSNSFLCYSPLNKVNDMSYNSLNMQANKVKAWVLKTR